MSKKIVVTISIFVLLILLLIYFANLSYSVEIYSMNTVIDIKVWGINRFKIVNEIESEINRLNLLFDDFNPNSEVSKINSNAGVKPVDVSPETVDIIKKAKDMYFKTDGSFNIMIAPVLNLWGFKTGEFRVPSDSEIESALKLTNNINDIEIIHNSVFLKRSGEEIDLGGIAKGYTLDKVYEILKRNNINKAIVNMGGNVLVYSKNPDDVFKIGIKHPRSNGIIAVVQVKSGTFIATSGDYERFFEYNGVRYCHIIDPKTGKPAQRVVSTTAITNVGYIGDVLSTAMFVEGKEGTFSLANKFNIASVVVDDSLKIFYTDNLKGLITLETGG
ncbi:FAD:protein FMN transferase [Caldisericum exile]|uniref:FAD:protein FMN transferase n=1 Tax=Caldisericum exile (strain DSM 21853 / NBRC 104410 / AZM16c01) TaxID=511051 RepID=A0A7U6JEU6_CALEA|nr:FAD:protein FMN transferase [Caldisericum exile]BAL81081.1 ApbE family protein [Caldisericum exile AZM16c01]